MAGAGTQISLSQLVEQLERLKAENDALRARVDAIEAERPSADAKRDSAAATNPRPGPPGVSPATADAGTWSRRALFRRAGMAAVGGLGIAAAGALVAAQPALATGNLVLDYESNASSSPTGWAVSDNAAGSFSYGLGVTDHTLGAFPSSATIAGHSKGTYDAALLGYHENDGDGVQGRADGNGSGVMGHNTANGDGVQGIADGSGAGVSGHHTAGIGVKGVAGKTGSGVMGTAYSTSVAVGPAPGAGVLGVGDNIGVGGLATRKGSVGVLGAGLGPGSRGALLQGIQAPLNLAPGSRATHPTSGGLRGDLYVDKGGRLWYCRTGGTHPVWIQLA